MHRLRNEMRKPITGRQLCAIVRDVIEHDRVIDDAEWKERTKCRIVALGYDYPRAGPAAIAAAISQVECALRRRWGRRPAPVSRWVAR